MASRSIYTGPSNTDTENKPASNFDDIYTTLTKDTAFPVLPSASPNPSQPSLSNAITSLHLHPVLEAILHILNNDLPSAHFLCRHMQAPPAFEAMFLHGLLHRIEGDYRNAQAWYGDVSESEVFQHVWGGEGGLDGAKEFIDGVERLRKEGEGDRKALEEVSQREIERLIEWCKGKFGTGQVVDATKVWLEHSEKTKEIATKQVVGGEGWRQF